MKKILSLFFLLFIFILPKRHWSAMVGFLSDQKIPSPLRPVLLGGFAKLFSLNMHESEKPLSEFISLNQLFTRTLKPDVRPLSKEPVLSPVDARVLIYGDAQETSMLQVKGKEMSVSQLLVGSLQSELAQPFFGGKFITLYLSPSDYHRIHSPAQGKIYAFSYVPGNFFPVNRPAVEGINNLFNRNERWTTFLQTPHGKIAVVKVAATSVGRIPVNYEPQQKEIFKRRQEVVQTYNHTIEMQKGQEFARFELGSTVILLLEKNCFEFFSFKEGQKINYGEPIAVDKSISQ